LSDNNKIAMLYLLLGNCYSRLNQFDSALENYTLSLKLRQQMGDIMQAANTLNNIGSVYSDMGNFNNALKYYNEALALRRQIKDVTGISTTLNNIGNLYLSLGNKDKALAYFQMSLKSAEQVGFVYNVALCSRKIGEIYLAQHNTAQAILYFEKSVQLGMSISNLELQKKGYFAMYSYYYSIGDFKSAINNYTQFNRINDSINVSMTNKKLLDMQVDFELGRKAGQMKKVETEVALLRKEHQLNELKDVRRKQTIFILLVLTLLVFSIGILYYNRYQLKRKAAILLQEKFSIVEETNNSLKKSEEELKRINNTKDKFFSIMAHDIKNPLAGLVTITEILHKDFRQLPDAEKEEIFETINGSAKQLYNLLENLLHWSRSQTGKIPLNLVELAISSLVDSNIELLKVNAEEKNIMIINMIKPELKLKADKDMISLVFRNLLSNAVKFTPDGGKVIVSAEQKNDNIEFVVEDNGLGISKEDANKLFRIDTQYSNPGTRKEAGTGLGLILCKEFIQKHKGAIGVESEQGKGSKFIFTLPIN